MRGKIVGNMDAPAVRRPARAEWRVNAVAKLTHTLMPILHRTAPDDSQPAAHQRHALWCMAAAKHGDVPPHRSSSRTQAFSCQVPCTLYNQAPKCARAQTTAGAPVLSATRSSNSSYQLVCFPICCLQHQINCMCLLRRSIRLRGFGSEAVVRHVVSHLTTRGFPPRDCCVSCSTMLRAHSQTEPTLKLSCPGITCQPRWRLAG